MAKKPKLFIVKTKTNKPDKLAFLAIFGERLQDARGETIYSRQDVADACGVSLNTVRMWEEGRAVTPAAYWITVCEMLYIDPWRLLTGRGRRSTFPDLPPHLRNPHPKVRARKK